MKSNRDYAAYMPNLDDSFVFYIDPDLEGDSLSDFSEAIIELYGGLFEYAHGFLSPEEIEVTIGIYSAEISMEAWRRDSPHPDPKRVESFRISGSETRQKLREGYEEVRTSEDESKVIESIRGLEVGARIWLPVGDEMLTAGHKWFRFDEGLTDEHPPAGEAPFRIDLTHNSRTDGLPTLHLRISSYCDIWTEESEVGERNRERLAQVFEHLEDNFRIHYGLAPGYFNRCEYLDSINPEEYVNTDLAD